MPFDPTKYVEVKQSVDEEIPMFGVDDVTDEPITVGFAADDVGEAVVVEPSGKFIARLTSPQHFVFQAAGVGVDEVATIHLFGVETRTWPLTAAETMDGIGDDDNVPAFGTDNQYVMPVQPLVMTVLLRDALGVSRTPKAFEVSLAMEVSTTRGALPSSEQEEANA